MSRRWMYEDVEEWGRPTIMLGRLLVHITDADHLEIMDALHKTEEWLSLQGAEALYQAAIHTMKPDCDANRHEILALSVRHESAFQAVTAMTNQHYQRILEERRVVKARREREEEEAREKAIADREAAKAKPFAE